MGTTIALTSWPSSSCSTPTTARFGHFGVGLEALLDLGGIHVLRAPNDEVTGPRVDHQLPVFEAAYVSCAEPSPRQNRLACLLGELPVFQHDRGAADKDLAVNPLLHGPADSIPNLYLDSGKGPAGGMGLVL